jgi:hypothetical protein
VSLYLYAVSAAECCPTIEARLASVQGAIKNDQRLAGTHPRGDVDPARHAGVLAAHV